MMRKSLYLGWMDGSVYLKIKEINYFGVVSVGIIVFWLLLFSLIPFLMVFVASFLQKGEDSFLAPIFTLNNYIRLFDMLYAEIFLKSFYLAIGTTILCLIIGYPFAYLLTTFPKKYQHILLLLVIIPFWTSSLIRTYALIAIIKTEGLLNSLLLNLGIINKPLEIMYTQVAIFIGMVYTLLPFMILPLYATLEKLDKRYIEASMDLGANRFQTFLKIILPLSMPGVIAGTMLVFLPSLGIFYIPDILGGAKDLIIGSFIRNQFLIFRDWGFGSAANVVLMLLMGLMLLAYYKSSKTINNKKSNI